MSEIVSQKIVSGNSKLKTGNCTQSLFGIVQGGMYTDLRKQSAEQIVAMDFPGHAIGGVSLGAPPSVWGEGLDSPSSCVFPKKPRVLQCVGPPRGIVQYAP